MLHTHSFIYTLLFPEGRTAKPGNLLNTNTLSEIGDRRIETYFDDLQRVTGLLYRQLLVMKWFLPSWAYFSIHSLTPLPRGVYYNLNIPNGGHTPCTTTPISLVAYVIKRPLPASLSQTTSQ
jgi:hypothetical protein